MTFKATLVAAAIAASFFSIAHAETRTVGTIGTDEVVETFTPAKGSFFDTINFDIAGPSVLSASGTNFLVKLGSKTIYDIAGLSMTFWDNVHPNGIVSYGTFSGDGATFSINLPTAGSYHVDISGVATGKSGGLYTVVMSTVSAVPEPESYALFLAGLGLMGTIARRRASKATA